MKIFCVTLGVLILLLSCTLWYHFAVREELHALLLAAERLPESLQDAQASLLLNELWLQAEGLHGRFALTLPRQSFLSLSIAIGRARAALIAEEPSDYLSALAEIRVLARNLYDSQGLGGVFSSSG